MDDFGEMGAQEIGQRLGDRGLGEIMIDAFVLRGQRENPCAHQWSMLMFTPLTSQRPVLTGEELHEISAWSFADEQFDVAFRTVLLGIGLRHLDHHPLQRPGVEGLVRGTGNDVLDHVLDGLADADQQVSTACSRLRALRST